jgi:hypothetical protein
VKIGADLLRKPGKLDRRELALSVERAGEGIGRHADTLSDIAVPRARTELLQMLEHAVSDAGHAHSLPVELGKSQLSVRPSVASEASISRPAQTMSAAG